MNRPPMNRAMPCKFHPSNDNGLFTDDFTGPEIRSGLAAMAGLTRPPEPQPDPARAVVIICTLAAIIVRVWAAGGRTPPPSSVTYPGIAAHEIYGHWTDALHAAKTMATLANLTLPTTL